MNETMNNLLEIRHVLKKSCRLSDLWNEFSLVWQELGWQQPQLRLWLATMPGIEITRPKSENPGYQIKGEQHEGEGLAEEIFNLINTSGLPMPIAQLQDRLPPSFGATEPMIKAAVKSHGKLMLMGPVVRVKK